MSFFHWSGVAALALLPLAAMAQQARQTGPADPNAPVPASRYVSAFRDYRAVGDEQGSPDQAWRTANEAVADQGAHAGHGAPKAGAPAAAPPATPAPTATPAPHAGHGGHRH